MTLAKSQLTINEFLTLEEYLALEELAEFRSAYINGQIIPMTGGSTNHNQIAGNFYAALNFALKRQKYRVFMENVRLWIPKKRICTYPDVMVIAGEPEYLGDRDDTITNPLTIIEVLSKSTSAYDKDKKFSFYSTIPTFQEYILIDQYAIHIQQFSKTANKRWTLVEYDEEDIALSLTSFQFQIPLLDIYDKAILEPVEVVDDSLEHETKYSG
jgi:Uma2 family endonuclease